MAKVNYTIRVDPETKKQLDEIGPDKIRDILEEVADKYDDYFGDLDKLKHKQKLEYYDVLSKLYQKHLDEVKRLRRQKIEELNLFLQSGGS